LLDRGTSNSEAYANEISIHPLMPSENETDDPTEIFGEKWMQTWGHPISPFLAKMTEVMRERKYDRRKKVEPIAVEDPLYKRLRTKVRGILLKRSLTEYDLCKEIGDFSDHVPQVLRDLVLEADVEYHPFSNTYGRRKD
jgi:hypothetical protein